MNDWSGLDTFKTIFLDAMNEGMEMVAQEGEEFARDNGRWRDDTSSLRHSITGYAPGVGDPFRHFDDPAWQYAQKYGNLKNPGGFNPPEHYYPVDSEYTDTGADPTAIVTMWTEYPMDDLPPDEWLFETLQGDLMDAGQHMVEVMPRMLSFMGTIDNALRDKP